MSNLNIAMLAVDHTWHIMGDQRPEIHKYTNLEEGEVTGQLFGRLSLTLMRANALMLSTRCQDADFPIPHVDSIEY